MEKNLAQKYNHKAVEEGKYNRWIEKGYFTAGDKSKDPFTIVIPPPNVTGILHIGHAWDNTLQDIIARYKRMQGYDMLFLPGMDHAGIATQAKVDARLKSEGISRYDLGREKFLERAWEWKAEYAKTIRTQWGKLGNSLDYSRERFTMDDGFNDAVRHVFVKLYNEGLIYRGWRIINWDPEARTALSNIEVYYQDDPGKMYHFKYVVKETGEEFVVATTRPETMFGDVCVVVNPSDEKLNHLIGKHTTNPANGQELPIIGDDYVEIGFGTGAMKCTPAHDPNDFAIAERHHLEKPICMNPDGTMNELCGKYEGMDRYVAREALVKQIETDGNLVKIEEMTHNVAHSERTHCVVEQYLSQQWFVKMKPLAEDVLKYQADEETKINFYPERFEKTFNGWLENIEDWCISRQLWWGHRIPVFYCDDCGWQDALMEDTDVCPKCGGHHVHQDEDVLDTWFSSQLWTFATQGWPNHPEQLEGHHPTQVLVTARDIIALWVARMIMSSLYFTKEIPFHDVYIYATILAKDGSRMSKSKGNGVDPMDLIAKYGADAMRYNLLTLITNNQDVKFDAVLDKKTCELVESPRTDQARSFVTKIWNASRFVQMNLDGYTAGMPKAETPEDAWMFSRLAKVVAETTEQLETYGFGEYARNIQSFFWNDVCDWYIELCKGRLLDGTPDQRLQVQRNLVFVLDVSMRLLHPAMPFVSESVWDALPASGLLSHDTEFLMVSEWPDPQKLANFVDESAEHNFSLAKTVVSAVRSSRARYRLSPKTDLAVVVKAPAQDVAALKEQAAFIQNVGRVSSLEVAEAPQKPAGSVSVTDAGLEMYVVLGELVDLTAEAKRLQKDLESAKKELSGVECTLANQGFVAKAAPEVIEKKRARAEELTTLVAQLEQQIADFS